VSYVWVIMNDELEIMWMEVVVFYFKVVSQHSSRGKVKVGCSYA
jgi:hypothetical protein